MNSKVDISNQFTLGIEEEFQIVDPQTRELRSRVCEILEEGKTLLGEQAETGMIQSMIEVGTGICERHNRQLAPTSQIFAAFSPALRASRAWRLWPPAHIHFRIGRIRRFSTMPGTSLIVEENQMIARSLLTFGLHVHVGIADPERAIQIMNAVRYMLPHVLALSTSSPFLARVHTGLKSYRSEVFTRMPGPAFLTTSSPTVPFSAMCNCLSGPGASTTLRRFIGTYVPPVLSDAGVSHLRYSHSR
jgi:carboxylate-amine ligase